VTEREAGALGAQDLVAADRVDPEPGLADQLEHLARRVRLHRVADHHARRGHHQLAQATERGAQGRSIVEIEWGPQPVGEGFERKVGESHGRLVIIVEVERARRGCPLRDRLAIRDRGSGGDAMLRGHYDSDEA